MNRNRILGAVGMIIGAVMTIYFFSGPKPPDGGILSEDAHTAALLFGWILLIAGQYLFMSDGKK